MFVSFFSKGLKDPKRGPRTLIFKLIQSLDDTDQLFKFCNAYFYP